MLSKNQQKTLKALATKKERRLTGQFLVQGQKNVLELLNSSLELVSLFVTETFADKHFKLLATRPIHIVNEEELSKVSSITSNNAAIAIVKQPVFELGEMSGVVLALDDVNDPGNLGTIIRLADWYGIEHLVLSQQTADVYNPKTISATMGAFTRVKTYRTDLKAFLNKQSKPIWGAFLDGQSIHDCSAPTDMIIVLGNESHGISKEISELVTDKITIPKYGQSESLNVAMATGIILDNVRRTQS